MYDAWPYGFSPRLGAVYSLNSDTVLRASVARTFGSVKNTGGSSHWNGFIGGYNVTAPAFPASSAFNWDGMARLAGAAVPRPQHLERQHIPYWNRTTRASSRGLHVVAQPAAAVAGALRRGSRLQRAARPAPDDEPPQPQSGPSRDFLRVRPAAWTGESDQPDEFAHGFHAGATGQHPVSLSELSGVTVGAAGATSISPVLDIVSGSDGGDRSGRSSYHALVLKGEKRYASGLTFLTSYVFRRRSPCARTAPTPATGAHEPFQSRREKGLSAFDETHVIKLNYSYELPFGPGKPFVKDGVAAAIVGGWRISGVNARVGYPLSVFPRQRFPLERG